MTRIVCFTLLLSLAQTARVTGATVDLSATERGAYEGDTNTFGTGFSGTAIGNYLTGDNVFFGSGNEFRSFFNFDLSSVAGTITSASFEFSLNQGGSSGDALETFGIFDFTGSIPALIGDTGGASAFSDLGSGTLYGSAAIDPAVSTGTATISLSAAAIAAMNTAIGGDFAFGGAITSLDGDPDTQEQLFRTSGDSNNTTVLHLEVGNPIPEPSALTLLATLGLLSLGMTRRRRRR